MEDIRFPFGMNPANVDDKIIFMIYHTRSADGQPNRVTLGEIRSHIAGKVDIDNPGFVSGGQVIEAISRLTLSKHPELSGMVAAFGSDGDFVSAGNMDDFIKGYNTENHENS